MDPVRLCAPAPPLKCRSIPDRTASGFPSWRMWALAPSTRTAGSATAPPPPPPPVACGNRVASRPSAANRSRRAGSRMTTEWGITAAVASEPRDVSASINATLRSGIASGRAPGSNTLTPVTVVPESPTDTASISTRAPSLLPRIRAACRAAIGLFNRLTMATARATIPVRTTASAIFQRRRMRMRHLVWTRVGTWTGARRPTGGRPGEAPRAGRWGGCFERLVGIPESALDRKATPVPTRANAFKFPQIRPE